MVAFRFGTSAAHKKNSLRAQIKKSLQGLRCAIGYLVVLQQRPEKWLQKHVWRACKAAYKRRVHRIKFE